MVYGADYCYTAAQGAHSTERISYFIGLHANGKAFSIAYELPDRVHIQTTLNKSFLSEHIKLAKECVRAKNKKCKPHTQHTKVRSVIGLFLFGFVALKARIAAEREDQLNSCQTVPAQACIG